MRASRLHLIATIIWAAVAVPTVVWLRDSVLWVALLSVYAIVIAHATAYEAAKAKEAARRDADTSTAA